MNPRQEYITAGTGDTGIIPLTSLDIYEGIYAIGFVFFYSQTLDEAELKNSLRKTLKEFPILTGRLVCLAGKGQHVICNDHGLLFSTVASKEVIGDFNRENHAKELAHLYIDDIIPWKVKNSDRPLATVKLTQFNGGGSALGISILHSIADGESFFHFVDSWARTHRGLPFEAPCHERILLEKGHDINTSPLPEHHAGFRILPLRKIPGSIMKFLYHKGKVRSTVVHFTRDELDQIKERASVLENGERRRISTNDALCAHLWQVMAHMKEKNGDRRLLFVANIRRKNEPPLPEHFFGNASLHMIIDMNHDELTGSPLSRVAAESRSRVNAIDQAAIDEELSWLSRRIKRGELYRVFADYDPFRDDLFISSDAPYAGYEADFGGGRPFWITIGTYPVPWSLLFMPDPLGREGIDVHVHLSGKIMKKFNSAEVQRMLHRYGGNMS